jgi:hypothetical protein
MARSVFSWTTSVFPSTVGDLIPAADVTSCTTDLLVVVVVVVFILRPTVSQPVGLGVKHPSGAYDQIFITFRQLRVLLMSGALSNERTGLSSTMYNVQYI